MAAPPRGRPPAVKSPVTVYAEDVVSGRQLAGRLVRLACKRHLDNLKPSSRAAEAGYYFDEEAAQHGIDFYEELLCLAEGEFADKPFLLEPAQKFIVGSVNGWMGPDGYRRFRKVYIEMGKGNGKTPLAAGQGLKGLMGDNEPGAEIYSSAVTRDQAGYLFADAKKMVEKSPALASRIEINVANMAVLGTDSYFRPLSSEARSLDQKRVHIALIDEIHEHPTALVVEKMEAGTKGRRQPIIYEITNSGYDRNSICYQHHDYSTKVLEGVILDDEWFAYVCQLDACDACQREGKSGPTEGCENCDDWRDERVWVKANPLLDVTVTRKYLRSQVRQAEGMPAKQDIVKRLNFCIWTEGFARWLDMDVWDASAGDLTHAQMEKMLAGRECYAGLDLSSTQDLTALSLVFPDGEGGYDVLTYCWCPKEGIRRRSQVDRVPYDVWVREGYLTATEGRVVDYKAVRRRINELNEVYNIKDIAIDRWNATELAGELEDDGFDVVFFGQGFSSFTDPTKAVERALLAGNWRHGGHPVLRWSASNTMVEPGENEAVKPSKKRSREKIDPIVTGIMGTDRAIRHEGGGPSVYEERGLRYLDDDDDYEDEDEGGDQWEDDEDADLIDEDDE